MYWEKYRWLNRKKWKAGFGIHQSIWLRYLLNSDYSSYQFSSVQSLSRVRLFVTPWIAARPASLSITISRSSLKLKRPSSRWCRPAISSSVVPFSSHLQSFPASASFPMSQFFASGGQSIGVSASDQSPLNEYSGLISFRIDWFDLAVQGTLKSLLQYHSLKVKAVTNLDSVLKSRDTT